MVFSTWAWLFARIAYQRIFWQTFDATGSEVSSDHQRPLGSSLCAVELHDWQLWEDEGVEYDTQKLKEACYQEEHHCHRFARRRGRRGGAGRWRGRAARSARRSSRASPSAWNSACCSRNTSQRSSPSASTDDIRWNDAASASKPPSRRRLPLSPPPRPRRAPSPLAAAAAAWPAHRREELRLYPARSPLPPLGRRPHAAARFGSELCARKKENGRLGHVQ